MIFKGEIKLFMEYESVTQKVLLPIESALHNTTKKKKLPNA
jgi:hypothetical protein